MFDHILDCIPNVAHLCDVRNEQNMTPLTLAAHSGSKVMMEHLLERSSSVQRTDGQQPTVLSAHLWIQIPLICVLYPLAGPVTCLIYPLKSFDVIPGSSQGVLEHVVR